MFAPVILIGAVTGVSTPATVVAAGVFVVARLAHYLFFVFGVPFARTPAFLVASVATVVIAATLLGHGM